MPADNDVPGLLLSLRDLAGRCRPAAMLYLTEDDSNMLNEAADALDRAQRELTAFAEWAAEFGGDDLHNDPKAHARRQIERFRASLPSPEGK